jgi:hypothetical protein
MGAGTPVVEKEGDPAVTVVRLTVEQEVAVKVATDPMPLMEHETARVGTCQRGRGSPRPPLR